MKGKVGPSVAGAKCPLRSAHAHAAEHHDNLRVTVGYTASEPTGATIEVRSGAKRIASTHRHLGKSGVLRIAKKLKANNVNRIVVRFTTRSCAKFQTKPVSVG